MSKHIVIGMHLVDNIGADDIKQESSRKGFGRGLLEAGKQNNQVVALCADLTTSTQISVFAEAFPERFVEMGVAEQNLVTVATGMAAIGKVPFASSYAAFCPGRCWEQIRTTIALNNRPVKIIGSHAGLSVGPDGATHQMLEDIALMRALPNMVVVAPADSVEAEKITRAIAENGKPTYMRLSRADTPIFTTEHTPFELGKAYVMHEGSDITLIGTGSMTYQCLVAAKMLAGDGVIADVLHVPTIKPLDEKTIIASAKKTRHVITVEEAQIAGGLGGAVAELLGEHLPTPLIRVGVRDHYGESGEPNELLSAYGLTGMHIAIRAHEMLGKD
ncbi:MAG TPA: transketolase C-terminal domain-containing protein [Patescibacteria group bacterium]|jgi:transketolase|nr:transketolase C-terminal domain-containing protein [Patescibacteria group bacterium]